MRRRLAKGLLVLGLMASFVGSDWVPAAAQSAKIGFVDLQKVVLESKRGKEAVTKLQAEKDAKQREVDAQEKKIRQMEADLEKQRSVLSEAARKERERTIRNAKVELKRTVDDLNRDFVERERDLRDRLIREVAEVVKAYGQKNGYTLIMEARAGGVMYGSDQADLSKEILAAYDASASGKR
jgi:outer membrane protein